MSDDPRPPIPDSGIRNIAFTLGLCRATGRADGWMEQCWEYLVGFQGACSGQAIFPSNAAPPSLLCRVCPPPNYWGEALVGFQMEGLHLTLKFSMLAWKQLRGLLLALQFGLLAPHHPCSLVISPPPPPRSFCQSHLFSVGISGLKTTSKNIHPAGRHCSRALFLISFPPCPGLENRPNSSRGRRGPSRDMFA